MDRLISEQAVLDEIDTWVKSSEPYDGNGNLIPRHLHDRIKAIPSAEPIYYPPCEDGHKKMNEIRKAYDKIQLVESKTGHWIDADGDNAICGCCNRLNHLYGTYCKHCGARMIEEQEGSE